MYYIQEADKLSKIENIIKKVNIQGNKLIVPITKEKIECRKYGNEKNEHKKAIKLAKKIVETLENTNSRKIVLSNNIKEYTRFVDELYTYNIDIVDGKKMFSALSIEVMEYLIKKRNFDIESLRISILINDLTEWNLNNIQCILSKYLKVNIVTNNIDKFKHLQEKQLSERGLVIAVGNNKKKGIIKSDMILNFDFPTELINKYQIKQNATIINFQGNVTIQKKSFEGLNINDYNININNIVRQELKLNEDDIDKYKENEIYEVVNVIGKRFSDVRKNIEKDRVRIKYLKANKTRI